MNPLRFFKDWYQEETAISNLKLPAACCFSTIGLDGYPNARFVSLKDLTDDSFIITGPRHSRKGQEIKNQSTAALTFWWTMTERQVRIQGDVTELPNDIADEYFEHRNQDSKIVSSIFDQGKEIQNIEDLRSRFESQKEDFKSNQILRPENWGGFYIKPIRIEFMQFKSSRLHERKLFENKIDKWSMKIIQP